MRNKETFWLIIILAVCFFLFCGCSARKKVVKEERTEQVRKEDRLASDNSVMEYRIDTTRLCEQEIELERTEYYQTGAVKSVTRQTIKKKDQKAGKTEATASVERKEQVQVQSDSASVVKQKEKTKTPPTMNWWWLIVIAAVLGIYIFWKTKIK